MSTQIYIDEGWHTVPHTKQTITRDGKEKRFGLPKKWQQYKEDFNEISTSVGSVIPGEQSNLIVIDCDSTEATAIMTTILPHYKAVTYSIGKIDNTGKEVLGSNWFFYYTPGVPVIHNGMYKLEVFSGDNDTQQVFLPTKNNETKTSWEDIPDMTEIPASLISILKVWEQASAPRPQTQTHSSYTPNHTFNLAPLIEKQLTREQIIPNLFGILTPKTMRSNIYREQGYLLPSQVEDGDGNDYLKSISAILGSDSSVSKDLYISMMEFINNQWEHPWNSKRLNTLTDYMMTGQARINGKPIWVYDEQWEAARFMDYNKVENLVEYFQDPTMLEVMEVNHTTNISRVIKPKVFANIFSLLTTKQVKGKNKAEVFLAQLPAMTAITRPTLPFGPLPTDRYKYNRFMASPALEVLLNPSTYASDYTYPESFHKYMLSLMPLKEDREYTLRHLVTKLTTFKYSPVVYYFVGAAGSGKNLFIDTLSKLIGEQYVGTGLGAAEATGVTNGWLEGTFFAHFDELHDTLTTYAEKKKANGNIKKWSGAKTFALRKMQSDTVQEAMQATFILTQNGDSFKMDIDDRRYMYLHTPNKLNKQVAIDVVSTNILDIAYYLIDTYLPLNIDEYMEPPMSESKVQSIQEKQPYHLRILSAIQNKHYHVLYEMIMDTGTDMSSFTRGRDRDLIYGDSLVELYRNGTNTTASDQEILSKFKLMVKKGALTGQPTQAYHNNVWTISTHEFSDSFEPIQQTGENINV